MLGFVLEFAVPIIAILLSLWAISAVTRRRVDREAAARTAALEEQVRGLLHRVWTLEQQQGDAAPAGLSSAPEDTARASAGTAAVHGGPPPSVAAGPVPPSAGEAPPAASPVGGAPPSVPSPAPSSPAAGPLPPSAATPGPSWPPRPGVRIAVPLPAPSPAMPAPGAPAPPSAAPSPVSSRPRSRADLEHRIGARWTTWIGIIAVLFAVSFFFRWAFEQELLGPGWRVVLGLLAGLVVLAAGVALGRRPDLPYLSEGLAGLGLGVLYLSLYGAHVLYGYVGPGTALGAMCAVTALGAFASIATGRQVTAVLALLGGLLTPVLLVTSQRDERNLLAYLLVLNLFVLAVAAFRTWPALVRVAWVGTALLVTPIIAPGPGTARPLARLLLLSALFALFLATPLLRRAAGGAVGRRFDLVLAVANAAGYFYAVHATLADRPPWVVAAWAVGLAVVYRAVAAEHASRAPGDSDAIAVHEGLAWTFLTIAVPLFLGGSWITLAWAAEGVALLWMSQRTARPVAAWGGVVALALAAARVVAVDRWGPPGADRVWNAPFGVHLAVVVALVIGGALAGRSAVRRPRWLTGRPLRSFLWLVAPLVLAALVWREPAGLWPATWLTVLLLAVAWWARMARAPGLVMASAVLGAIVLARVFIADDDLARGAADALVHPPLVSRIVACIALCLAGGWVARSPALAEAGRIGRAMSAVGGAALLFALSVNWTRHQQEALAGVRAPGADLSAEVRWRTQVGLSVLWTVYAGAALAWGAFRSRPGVRYAALALLGFTVIKVFAVDLSAVRTSYRMLSFLVLGVVLLLVGVIYQKARRGSPAATAPD